MDIGGKEAGSHKMSLGIALIISVEIILSDMHSLRS